MNRTVKYIALILLFLYLAALLTLCIIQTDSLPQVEAEWFGIPADKIVHFTMFVPLPVLMFFAFYKEQRSRWKQAALLAAILVIGMAVAAGTELLQSMTDYREGDILDFTADCTGMLAGLAILFIVMAIVRKKNMK